MRTPDYVSITSKRSLYGGVFVFKCRDDTDGYVFEFDFGGISHQVSSFSDNPVLGSVFGKTHFVASHVSSHPARLARSMNSIIAAAEGIRACALAACSVPSGRL